MIKYFYDDRNFHNKIRKKQSENRICYGHYLKAAVFHIPKDSSWSEASEQSERISYQRSLMERSLDYNQTALKSYFFFLKKIE